MEIGQAGAGQAAQPVSKFSGANGDRKISIFPVQLTTNRIGNLTGLIHTLLYVVAPVVHLVTLRPSDVGT